MKKMMSVWVPVVLVVCGQLFAEAGDPEVSAFEARLMHARPLPLECVRLVGGPLKNAQDLDVRTLLGLEPDRMLAYYRKEAGLKPKAKPYGGWDGGGRKLTGHIAGHYLSAVSLMYAATGDERFKERAEYIVQEFKNIQDKHGDGYLSALANGRKCWKAVSQGDIRSRGFDLNGLWSPWYTLHKTYAGLRDAYRHTGNRTALDIEIKFAAWADGILSKLTDQQIQRMLNTEFGGMNEVMIDLYADTGNRRWLDLSYKFEHRSFIEPLKRYQDILPGKHANTQVPKLIGSIDRFAYTGSAGDLLAAGFFWDRVVHHHSFATGGHGKDEYFGQADKLNVRVDGRTNETCNVYNMLKLTRRLFCLRPDAHYADFHERALFNHILASIDANDGWACYMVPVGRGVSREYERNMLDGDFTCCTGTSLESHALHADGIYYESADTLYVNLYAPSTAEWAAAGLKLVVDTDFPEGESAKFKLSLDASRAFKLALRRPHWAGDGFEIKVNGEAVADDVLADPWVPAYGRQRPDAQAQSSQSASHYVYLYRTWTNGDTVEVTLPKSLHLEPLPDNPRRVAILWGPLVLAGDLGPERILTPQRAWTQKDRVPVFVAEDKPVADWLKPVKGKPGHFRTAGVGREKDVEFSPFYRLHRRTYGVYWDMFTEAQWQVKQAEYAAEQEQLRKLELATVSYARPGEMQPERDYNFQSANDSFPIRMEGRPGRRGRSWFSFDMPIDDEHPMALVVTYYSAEHNPRLAAFEILADGRRIAEQEVGYSRPARFYDVEYAVPPNLVKGKKKITIKFQAEKNCCVVGVYGIRIIRADAQR